MVHGAGHFVTEVGAFVEGHDIYAFDGFDFGAELDAAEVSAFVEGGDEGEVEPDAEKFGELEMRFWGMANLRRLLKAKEMFSLWERVVWRQARVKG